MEPHQGIVEFELQFTKAPPPEAGMIRKITGWRKVLYMLKLVGQEPGRYGGFGYGNVSCRTVAPDGIGFVITGSQTSGLFDVGPEHFAVVCDYLPGRNRIVAEGAIPPSSESLTHGLIYGADPSLGAILHAHSPEIWRDAERLGIPRVDDADTTQEELARAIEETVRKVPPGGGILVMTSHEDGVFAFGSSADEAGKVLLCALAAALSLS